MTAVDTTIVVLALPEIQRGLHVDLRSMGVRLYATPTGKSDARLALRQVRNGDTRHWTEIVSEWTDADIEAFEADSETA